MAHLSSASFPLQVPSAGASLNDDLVKRSYQATSRKLPVAQSYYFTNKRGVSLDPPTTEWEVRSLYKTQAFEAEQQKRLAQAASTAGIRGLQKTLHYVDANTLQRTMQVGKAQPSGMPSYAGLPDPPNTPCPLLLL